MRKVISDDQLRHLIEVEQVTQREAAVRLGCSLSCVERTSKRLGLSTQRTGPRSGDKHPDWKGGRVLIGRYWYVWSATHPNRTKRNYIAEHRLIAEAMLGRYLRRTEVVHHRNGNGQDNRPENLEVFGSNAEHLKAELTGRVPNWTPEGWAAMQVGCRNKPTRAKRAPGASPLPQPSGHPPTKT